MKTEKYILPTYYASALINDDFSGLGDYDTIELNQFIKTEKHRNRRFYCINADIENCYFSYSNDINSLGAEVCEFTFDVSKIQKTIIK